MNPVFKNQIKPAMRMANILDKVNNRLNIAGARLMVLGSSEAFEQIEQQISAADTALDQINENLDRVNSTFKELEDSSPFEGIQQQISAAGDAIERINDSLDKAAAKFHDLESSAPLGQLQYQISAANAALDRANDNLDTLNTRLTSAGASAPFEQMQQQADAAAESVGKVQEQVDAVTAPAEKLQKQLDASTAPAEKLQKHLEASTAPAERTDNALESVGKTTKKNEEKQKKHNLSMEDAIGFANGLLEKLNTITGLFGVKIDMQSTFDFYKGSISMANARIQAEQKLANVLARRGATEADFMKIRQGAAGQGAGIYDTASMYGAAGELAKHVKDADAINTMLGAAANYAAGMSGGAGAGMEQMAGYAEQLGNVLEGKYDGFGIQLTEAQKQIIKNGTEMQKALVIKDAVKQTWGDIAQKMANTPQGMMTSITNAFNEIRTTVGTQFLPVLMSVFAVIQSNMPKIEQMLMATVPVIQTIIGAAGQILSAAFEVFNFLASNWAIVEPALWGIVGAMAAWKIITMLQTAETWLLNTALLANPVTWLVILIGAVVAAIVYWANEVGGFRVLWLVFADAILNAWDFVVDRILFAWDMLKLGFFAGIYWVLDLWDKMKLGLQVAVTAIANFMGDMKAGVLMILQSMLNGAIDMINAFIDTLNMIPGVNIGLIERVEFGTKAQLENEANKQARNQELENARAATGAAIASRTNELYAMANNANMAANERKKDMDREQKWRHAEISEVQDAALQERANPKTASPLDYVSAHFPGGQQMDETANKTAEIAANTRRTADMGEENIKYLRDVAERDAINRFTTSEIHVEQHNENHIGSKMDLDGVIDYLATGARDAMEENALGVHQ